MCIQRRKKTPHFQFSFIIARYYGSDSVVTISGLAPNTLYYLRAATVANGNTGDYFQIEVTTSPLSIQEFEKLQLVSSA